MTTRPTAANIAKSCCPTAATHRTLKNRRPYVSWFTHSYSVSTRVDSRLPSSQLLHLRQVRLEQPQRLAYGLWRGHIHPCLLQQLDTVVRGTRTQKLQVALNRRLSLAQNLLHQRRCRRDTRRILVHIKIVVEVRDTRPLDIDQFIDSDLCPIVLLIERTVHRTERISRQPLTLFCTMVDALLELGKHRLSEERTAEALQ